MQYFIMGFVIGFSVIAVTDKKVLRKGAEMSALKNMPPLYHSLPGHSFDIRNSEVIKWLVSNPEVLQYLFDKANKSGFIIYNPKTGKWQGVNYDN